MWKVDYVWMKWQREEFQMEALLPHPCLEQFVIRSNKHFRHRVWDKVCFLGGFFDLEVFPKTPTDTPTQLSLLLDHQESRLNLNAALRPGA